MVTRAPCRALFSCSRSSVLNQRAVCDRTASAPVRGSGLFGAKSSHSLFPLASLNLSTALEVWAQLSGFICCGGRCLQGRRPLRKAFPCAAVGAQASGKSTLIDPGVPALSLSLFSPLGDRVGTPVDSQVWSRICSDWAERGYCRHFLLTLFSSTSRPFIKEDTWMS